MLGDDPHIGAGTWRTRSGGNGNVRPPSGGVPHLVRRCKWSSSDHLRDGASSGVPPLQGPIHGRPPDPRGINPQGEGTCPQRYPWLQGVACPPQRRPSAPPARTPATVAGCAQGPDPERSARVPRGSGHWRPGGQDQPGGNRVPHGMAGQGDDNDEGHHGGQRLDNGAPGVLPAPGYTAK